MEISSLRIYGAPGAFALKLGEVIDDGHILKCASKNPKRPFPKRQHFTGLNIIHNSIEYTTRVYKNIRKGMQTILIPGPCVSYLLWANCDLLGNRYDTELISDTCRYQPCIITIAQKIRIGLYYQPESASD